MAPRIKMLAKLLLRPPLPRTITIGNTPIRLPAGHDLPYILKKWPEYSLNLLRLTDIVLKKYPSLRVLDIGANVGDTVALLRSNNHFPIACIEGDNTFFTLLEKNVGTLQGISTYKVFLDAQSGDIQATIKKSLGTAKIANSKTDMSVMSLDDFLEEQKEYRSAKILKIDTDGYDLKIIRGGMKYIQETKPVLFIEYDEVFLSKVDDDGLSTLHSLEKMGYSKVLFYDNYGRFILSAHLNDHALIQQMHTYIQDKLGAFPYYDLCIFHENDDDIADEFIKSELVHFRNRR